MVMSSKWMRLIGLVGFTAVLVSCKQTPQAPMNANYATMKITVSDKEFSTSYSATQRKCVATRHHSAVSVPNGSRPDKSVTRQVHHALQRHQMQP